MGNDYDRLFFQFRMEQSVNLMFGIRIRISCGIIALLLFYGKYLNTGIHPEEKAQKKDAQ